MPMDASFGRLKVWNAQKSHPFANSIQLALFETKEWSKTRMDAIFDNHLSSSFHPFANFIKLQLFQTEEWSKMQMDAFFGSFKA
jgi:hypothetical protein